MLIKNNISIFRKPSINPIIDYCLQFNGNGYISIDALTPFLDHMNDFYFEMAFKIDTFPLEGYSFLMNSCFDKKDNKLGIAIDHHNLFVQIDKGLGGKTELVISFNDTLDWHLLSVTNYRGLPSAVLDLIPLELNATPFLSLSETMGFRIASDTNNSQNLTGLVDNILITDLTVPLARYLLNEGSGSIANDSVGSNNGSIANASWVLY